MTKGKQLAPLSKLLEGIKSCSHTAAQKEGPLSSLSSNEVHVKAFGLRACPYFSLSERLTDDGDKGVAVSLCRAKTREA